MRFNELNDDNYLLFAIKFYDNPHAVTREDFEDDLKKIKYVNPLPKGSRRSGRWRCYWKQNSAVVRTFGHMDD